jgi:hypothetical protein
MKTHSPLKTLWTTSAARPQEVMPPTMPRRVAPSGRSGRTRLWIACTLFALVPGLQAQWVQQNILLRPGWNAVFLEVHPEPKECDALFAGLPVESVWDWNRPSDGVQFVQDPAKLVPGMTGWLTWFPREHALSSQSSLFILRDGRPYLIKLADNAPPTTWVVTGKPSLRRIVWQAGAVNLVGFHVGAQGPTFSALFAGETGLSGQPIYRLGTTGVWEQIGSPASERPRSGEAYWVRCRLPAQRSGTIEVDSVSRLGVRFTDGITEGSVRVRNTSSSLRNITLRLLPSVTPPPGQAPLIELVPLEYWKADYANVALGWEPLPPTLAFQGLPVGAEWNIRLGVRRPPGAVVAPGAAYQGLLEVTDDLGTRWLVGVSASPRSDAIVLGGLQPSNAHNGFANAGLWIGEAVVNAVSQPAHLSNATLPRPAGGQFVYRLLVHVDGIGQARLLQRAFLVRKPPLLTPDPDDPGYNRELEPARIVVVTDETLISGIIGTGIVEGRRISSAAFGFAQPQALSGGPFGVGALTGQITIGHNDSLNPFKHVYHPDHDNLDSRFEQTLPEGRESFSVIRQISLQFTETDPLGLNPPGWGEAEVGGIYRETFTGLHRNAIQTSGTFRLTRVVRVPDLNDSKGGLTSAANVIH